MWIRDNEDGEVRQYGTNHHDALVISADGRHLYYENLQNGDGSRGGGYSFVTDEKGYTPMEDEDLLKYGAEGYANIGGFGSDEMKEQLTQLRKDFIETTLKGGDKFEALHRQAYEQAKADIMEKLEAIEADFTAKHPDFETTDDKYVVAVMATLKVCKETVADGAD